MALWWLIGGVFLMLLELVVPGAVLIFLGVGALAVSGLVWLGIVEHLIPAFTSWFIASLALLLVLRGAVQKWSGGDEDWQSTDEDVAAMNTVVEVAETIRPGEPGRIVYQGTTWPAICHDHTIAAGAYAKLVYRENVAWVVEPTAVGPEDLNLD